MKNIEKAAQIIKLLVLDVDGVMTDGSIYLDAEQELFKSFNAKDGMGISCAIRCGLQVALQPNYSQKGQRIRDRRSL